jgi:integrase
MAYKVMAKDPAVPGGKRWTGLWRAEVELPNGRRVTRTDPLKRVVDAWAKELSTDVRRGRWRDPRDAKMTVAQWHPKWWATRSAKARKTRERNEQVWRLHVQPRWGEVALDEVTRTEVAGWAAGLVAAGGGIRTVQQAVGVLSMLLQSAIDEDPPILTGRNPCRGVLRELPPAPIGPVVFFTADQARAFTAELAEPYATLVEYAVLTGLRWGELAGLLDSCVDELHGLVHVQYVVEDDGSLREHPKSKRSRRTVPTPPHLRARLAALARDTTHPVMSIRGRAHGRAVFVDADGRPLDGDRFRSVWDAALKRTRTCPITGTCRDAKGQCRDAGHQLPPYTPHTMRHTAASWLVQAGMDLLVVQKLLGHESYATTMRYAHLAPDAHKAVLDVWARILPTQFPHEAVGGASTEGLK